MRCFIICTGASLKGFDFNRLKGHDVIAVNHAIKYVDAKYMVAIDFKSTFEKAEWKGIIKDTPIIVDSVITSADFNLLVMERGKIEGFDLRPNRVASGSNSGYMSINAAYHLGYREIYLLGMDMGRVYNERYFDRPGYVEKKANTLIIIMYYPGLK